MCTDTNGSYMCTCNTGFTGNGVVCISIEYTVKIMIYYDVIDINECLTEKPCDGNATCADLFGSFTCTCNAGFTGDGVTCQSDCMHEHGCEIYHVIPAILNSRYQ